jgi:ABC-type Na+ efflux pump permease subunit
MPRWRSIWLVARREILERGRSRGFILSVLFTTLIVIGSFIIPALLFGDESATKIGIVEPAPSALKAAIESTATRFDRTVVVSTYPDDTTANAALKDGTVAVVVTMPPDLSRPGEVRFAKEPDQTIGAIVSNATIGLRQAAILGAIATIATFLPPSAPFVVPLRAAFDAIPPWQIGVSVLITLAAIWVLFSIGARVYAGAVLQVGGRIKLRDAWRSAGE